MTVKWVGYLCLAGSLALLMGCRTPQPDLKPPKSPEVLRDPPQEARYETSEYPKQAFDTPKRADGLNSGLAGSNGMQGNRAMMGGPGGGGGMSGRGY